LSEPRVTDAPGVPRQEFLIQLNSERLAHVEQGLERNWIVQLVLAGVGLALVFDIGDLPKFLSRFMSQQEYSLRSVAAILLVILLYYFMKLGHLLTRFIEARKLHDRLLDEYLGERKRDLEGLRPTTSVFEVFYAPHVFARPLRVAYYLSSALAISTGQAAVLYLIFKAYGLNPGSVAVVVVALAAMGVCYWGFWLSKRTHPGTTALVAACAVMAVLLFVVFCVCAPREDGQASGSALTLAIRSLVAWSFGSPTRAVRPP
jgi:MFS family permease